MNYKSFSREKKIRIKYNTNCFVFFSLPSQWYDYSSRIRGNISSCRCQYAARWRFNFSYSRKCKYNSNSDTGHSTYQCTIAISQWTNVSKSNFNLLELFKGHIINFFGILFSVLPKLKLLQKLRPLDNNSQVFKI